MQMNQLLEQSASRHNHLCPRQVLGVRMGLFAGQVLNLKVPDEEKRLVTLVESDGCGADAISIATGCTVGNRRLRVLDFGKVAATFVDMKNDTAIRIVPRAEIRAISQRLFPEAKSRWHAQLKAYQLLSYTELLVMKPVRLSIPLEKLMSKPGYRVVCKVCGEEIINEREVILDGAILCRACAGQGYYRLSEEESCAIDYQIYGAPHNSR
jgi:formylmethanofuran dehydrogenase subunit E